MADAATTVRGLNDIAGNANHAALAVTQAGHRMMHLPDGQRGDAQVLGDFSTKGLFFAAAGRTAATGLLDGTKQSGVYSLTGDSWVAVDWDPETTSFDLWCNDATGTDGLEFTTDPAAAANAGMELPEGQVRSFYVADAPLGRMWIRRTNAGNSGNGSNTVKLNFISYGSRNMLASSRRNVDTAHS